MRLIHRRPRPAPLAEGEAYEHSYGEHVLDHVDLIRLEPTEVRTTDTPEVDGADHHVTTERLKQQFEERLAGRGRRRRSR